MTKKPGEGILFEMLRSFSTLARTLNLSRTVEETGATRQTIRRHIDIIEKHRGDKLFVLEDRQYRLTEAGKEALPEAEDLLVRGRAWLANHIRHVNSKGYLARDDDELMYYLQQHDVPELWENGTPLLQVALEAWVRGKGALESPDFAPIRPFCMIFRQQDENWLCVEVGEKSSYATWYGWTWQRSSVGRTLPNLPGGIGFAQLTQQPFEAVAHQYSARFDHIHTKIDHGPDGEMLPISYQRLLMRGKFADGSPALISVIERTYELDIAGLPEDRIQSMPEEFVMKTTVPVEKDKPALAS